MTVALNAVPEFEAVFSVEGGCVTQVCKMTVGVLGDICREMGSSIPEPTWNQIVWTLLESVGSDQLHRSVKPAILSCFGDIALTLDLGFKNYLQVQRGPATIYTMRS